MFWSLILEPSKRYSSTVKETFHLSMATLDTKKVQKDNEIYPVQLEIDGQELLLCNLSKPHFLHANLDLVFNKGTDVTFSTSGKATIHLTGYLVGDDSDEEYSSFGEEENDSAEDTVDDSLKKFKEDLSKSAAAKKNAAKQAANKRKLEPAEVVSKKKQKNANVAEDDDDDDDDDSSIDETELGKLVDSINEDDADTDSDDEDFDEEDDDEEGAEEEESEGDEEEDLDSTLEDSDVESDDESSEEEKSKQQQKPKKDEIKTPQGNKQIKTPVSNKKQEKQQVKNQLTNGVTPTSAKKDKKEKNQANQATPKQDSQKNQKPDNQKTPKQENQKTPKKGKEENAATPQSQKKQTIAGGVVIEELKPGTGPVAKFGKMVTVYYTGRLKNNNRVFDQSNQGPGFKFRLGNSEVIKAWDVGVNGMKVGSKRRITCPPAMAYGNKGSPPQIPPNSWLVFDVELKAVN